MGAAEQSAAFVMAIGTAPVAFTERRGALPHRSGDKHMARAPVPTPVNGDSKPADTRLEVADVKDEGVIAQAAEQSAGAENAAANEAGVDAQANVNAVTVEVRVLHDHLDHSANAVAVLPAEDAAAAVAAGWADDSAAAVAYAKSLG